MPRLFASGWPAERSWGFVTICRKPAGTISATANGSRPSTKALSHAAYRSCPGAFWRGHGLAKSERYQMMCEEFRARNLPVLRGVWGHWVCIL